MAAIPYHPAPGFGELPPGYMSIKGLSALVSAAFPVPQNPLNPNQMNYPAYGGGGVKYVPKMAEILPSRFATPSNPLIAQLRAGMTGCCCDGGSGDGSKGAAPDDTSTAYVNGSPIPGLSDGKLDLTSGGGLAMLGLIAAVGWFMGRGR